MYFFATSLKSLVSSIIKFIGSTSSSLFHLETEPIFSCHNRSWGKNPSWFASHSSTPCTCLHPRNDNKWVRTQGMIELHPTNVLRRLCDQTEPRTCCDVFLVSSPPCLWIQATIVFASLRIHVHSTRTRDNVHSMSCFLRRQIVWCLAGWQLAYWDVYWLSPSCLEDSEVGNDLICELSADHVVQSGQSLPRCSHLDHFPNLKVDGVFIVILICI